MRKIILLNMCLILASFQVFGQEKKVTIEVVDTTEELPMIGAHVCLISTSGNKKYYSTNHEGKVTIPFTESSKGSISYTGFKTKDFELNTVQVLKIKLKPDLLMLDQVVKTASVEPEKVDQSIYKIGIVSSKEMEKQGVQNVRDALRFQPNINLREDGVLGSQIIMQGLEGQHVKFLIDGMPIVGRQDGNIDLSQIDMTQVDHIEVIEGPMSVVYGSNALAGTINIITKENKYYQWSGNVGAYAESVGQLNGNVSLQGNKGKSKFGISGGYRYFNGYDLDESNRRMDWNPKNQINTDAYYGVKLSGWNTKFGIRLSHEDLTIKGNYLQPYRALDNNYITERITYYGQFDKKFKDQSTFTGLVSFNTYTRTGQEYVVKEDLGSEEKKGDPTVDRFNTLNARLSYGRSLNSWLNWQVGYELNHETGEGDKITKEDAALIENALWSDLKINITKHLILQPGVRFIEHNTYDAPIIYSTHLKWNSENNWSSRVSVAKGFRAPSMKELYMDFVDTNHKIYGNENLSLETSFNATATISKTIQINDNSVLKADASGFHNQLDDVIELIMGTNGVSYYYQNVSQKQTQGGTFSLNYNNNNRLKMNAGVTLTGIGYDFQNNGDFTFNYATDFVAMASYFWPKYDLSMQLDYKYTGERVQLMVDGEGNEVGQGAVEAYHMLNYSATKNFKNKRFAVTAGIKNILDVNDVTNTTQGGTHSGGSSMLIAWGRTYFVSLKFNLNKI